MIPVNFSEPHAMQKINDELRAHGWKHAPAEIQDRYAYKNDLGYAHSVVTFVNYRLKTQHPAIYELATETASQLDRSYCVNIVGIIREFLDQTDRLITTGEQTQP